MGYKHLYKYLYLVNTPQYINPGQARHLLCPANLRRHGEGEERGWKEGSSGHLGWVSLLLVYVKLTSSGFLRLAWHNVASSYLYLLLRLRMPSKGEHYIVFHYISSHLLGPMYRTLKTRKTWFSDSCPTIPARYPQTKTVYGSDPKKEGHGGSR